MSLGEIGAIHTEAGIGIEQKVISSLQEVQTSTTEKVEEMKKTYEEKRKAVEAAKTKCEKEQ